MNRYLADALGLVFALITVLRNVDPTRLVGNHNQTVLRG